MFSVLEGSKFSKGVDSIAIPAGERIEKIATKGFHWEDCGAQDSGENMATKKWPFICIREAKCGFRQQQR